MNMQITDLTDLERDLYEERAAICEFEGNMTREKAEFQAIKEIWALRLGKRKELKEMFNKRDKKVDKRG